MNTSYPCHGGVMVSMLDLASWGHRFDFQPFHCQVTVFILGQVIHTCYCLVKQYTCCNFSSGR